MAVGDKNNSYIISGTGDVLEPEGDVIGIGSGGNYALAAGKVLMEGDMSAEEVVEADRSKQYGERLLMEQEDIATKKFISVEQAIIKKELYSLSISKTINKLNYYILTKS